MSDINWQLKWHAPWGVYRAGKALALQGDLPEADPVTNAILDVLHETGWVSLRASPPEDLGRYRTAGGFSEDGKQLVHVTYVLDADAGEQAVELQDALAIQPPRLWTRFEFKTLPYLKQKQRAYYYDTKED